MASHPLGFLSALSRPARIYVLTVGEECAVLTLVVRGKVKNAWIVPGEAEEGAAEVKAVLQGDRKTPVALLADTFEQLYKDTPVPRVGRMDQAKVTRRYAAQAVPGDAWQGAVPQGSDPRGRSLFFLFCGLPRTDHVRQWVDVYEGIRNPKAGIHLLPLESLSLMNALFESDAKARGGVRWRIMTTMNVSGGLRQIVAKQGRMMLTRLTPAPPEDMPADEAAAMMARDFRQTLTYVKRLGYREGDALDLALIVDPALAEALQAQTWDAQSVAVMTPHAVGERLGLGSVGKPEQPFGDVLHAAWFARKSKPALVLLRPSDQKSDLARLGEALAPVAAVAGVGGVIAYAAITGTALWETHQRIERLEGDLDGARRALAVARADRAALLYAPDVMRDSLSLAERLATGHTDLMPLLRGIEAGLGQRAHATVLEMRNNTGGGTPARGRGVEAPKGLWTDMELILHDVSSAETALILANELMTDLRASLPEARVVMARPPIAILPDQTLSSTVRLERLGGVADVDEANLPEGASETREGDAVVFTMRIEITLEGAGS
jgi:hypothetical protein